MIGYNSVRKDRENYQGGGCITFIKDNLPFGKIKYSGQHECIAIEVYARNEAIKLQYMSKFKFNNA